ncbi:MAG: site-specific DNA-methyltransferase [Sumerlaeia bacterium]
MIEIREGDNLTILREMAAGSVNLIYIDPPFNTGKRQKRYRVKTVHDDEGGDRQGFLGRRYRTEKLVSLQGYDDQFGDDYLPFLAPRLEEAHRLLAPTGSLFFHCDPRESHYCKVLLDEIFGRASFLNEIIWSYDYGGRPKTRWPAKHDTIFWYARDPAHYTYNYDAIDRIPYMAPGLVGPEKAARGKTPTDVWWQTVVPTNGKEKTGYPTQKPIAIIRRIVAVHSNPGETVMDFFAGSGTLGAAAAELGRDAILIDNNPEAIAVMKRRLAGANPKVRKLKRWQAPLEEAEGPEDKTE